MSCEREETRCVLIVDDEDVARRAVVRTLATDVDALILQADSADVALDHLSRRRIDVVLSDFGLPGKNGLELLRRVREQSPDTTRLMLTATCDLALAMRAVKDGDVSAVLRKPWLDGQLVSAIRLALADAEMRCELRRLRAISRSAPRDVYRERLSSRPPERGIDSGTFILRE